MINRGIFFAQRPVIGWIEREATTPGVELRSIKMWNLQTTKANFGDGSDDFAWAGKWYVYKKKSA